MKDHSNVQGKDVGLAQGRNVMPVDPDLERDFIREFAVAGDLLTSSSAERCERIRVAIYRRNLIHTPFRDSGMDYGQGLRAVLFETDRDAPRRQGTEAGSLDSGSI